MKKFVNGIFSSVLLLAISFGSVTPFKGANEMSRSVLAAVFLWGCGTSGADFALTSASAGLAVAPGGSGIIMVQVSREKNFRDAVTLTLVDPPAGIAASVTVVPRGSDSASFQVSATNRLSNGAALGLTIRGTSGKKSHDVALTLTIVDFSIAISPASISLIQGGSGTVSLSIQPVTSPEKVVLTIDSLPTGVTASTGSFTNGSATLSLFVGTNATLGATTLTVHATIPDIDRYADLTVVVVPPFLVTGTVIDTSGNPFVGAQVAVRGGSITTTDENGAFALSGFEPPYDLLIGDGTGKNAIVYEGLTRTDPTLMLIPLDQTPFESSLVMGSVSGGTGNAAHTLTNILSFGSLNARPQSEQTTSANYAEAIGWIGSDPSEPFVAHALQYESNGAVFVGYTGYGTLDIAGHSAGAVSGQNISIGAAVTSTVPSGSISLPSGYAAPVLTFFATWLDNAMVAVPAGSDFGMAAPTLPDADLSIGVSAGNGTGNTFALSVSAQSAVSLAPTAAPILSSPANLSTGISVGAEFSWSPAAGEIHMVMFLDQSHTQTYAIVVTAAPSTRLPDLGALGIPLPPSSDFSWEVFGLGPYSDIDGAAGSTSLSPVLLAVEQLKAPLPLPFFSYGFPAGNCGASVSNTWVFKTPP